MKTLGMVLCLLIATSSFAGFGGSRGGGFSGGRSSFSSGRSSSFGGSRSGGFSPSRPAPIIRSAPSRSYSAPSAPHTTVINQGSGGGSGPGFFSGLLMGNILSGGHHAPVVVQGGAPVVQGPYAATPVYPESHGFFYYLTWMVVLGLMAWVAFRILTVVTRGY